MYLVNTNSKTAVRSCIDKLYVSETMIKFHVSSQDLSAVCREWKMPLLLTIGWLYDTVVFQQAATEELVRFSVIYLSVEMATFQE